MTIMHSSETASPQKNFFANEAGFDHLEDGDDDDVKFESFILAGVILIAVVISVGLILRLAFFIRGRKKGRAVIPNPLPPQALRGDGTSF
jgi:hypothetical protein